MSRSVDEILADIESATPEELVRVADTETTGEETGAAQDETAQADPATSGDAVSKPAEPEAKPEAPEAEAPVQSRDGKHTIPYEVLAQTREAKAAAEATAKAEAEARANAEAKAAQLQAELERINAGAKPTEQEAARIAAVVTPEELAQMRDDFPAMASVVEKMQAELARVQSIALAQANQRDQAEQEIAQQRTANEVQALIDANPKLAYLQASDPVGWQRAVDLDNSLRALPEMANISMADRFTKTLAAYEAMHGAINVAVSATPPQAAKTIDSVLADAKPASPKSLSDLPGGSPVAGNEIEGVTNMSSVELGAKFASMSPKQLEAYLNTIG